MGELQYPEHGGDELRTIRAQLRAALVLARSAAAKTKIVTQALNVLGVIRVLGSIQVEQNGAVLLLDDDSNIRTYLGPVSSGGVKTGHGLLIQRPDGTDVLDARAKPDGSTAFRVFDDGQTRILANDEGTGIGLAHPYLRAHPAPTRFTDWLASTSASFETVMDTWGSPWQPQVHVYGGLYAPASTTAEARVLCNGTQIGSTVSATNNSISTIDVYAPIPGVASNNLNLMIDLAQLQIRRTAGTGTVRGVLLAVETTGS